MTKYTINAEGRTIGRVASEAAKILIGKNTPAFEKNKITGGQVTILNASKVKLSEKKLGAKTYARYSGYPGGLTQEKMAHVIGKKGYAEIFNLAIYGMLPSNKLRAKMMKNLTVSE